MMKILLVDYSCHPFSLQLAQSFSEKEIETFYAFSKNVNLTGNFYLNFQNPKLKILPIKTKKFYKYNFLKRRISEIEFGDKIIEILEEKKINKII
ncbi:hypothetical protein N8006_04090, partial [Candidatus Pelagibacter ubique]|nr:hypothetical protein [Candidatus Pelagibacter ubique]